MINFSIDTNGNAANFPTVVDVDPESDTSTDIMV